MEFSLFVHLLDFLYCFLGNHEAVGIDDDNYQMVDAYKKDEVEAALDRLMAKDSLSLLVVKAPCVIYKRKKKL